MKLGLLVGIHARAAGVVIYILSHELLLTSGLGGKLSDLRFPRLLLYSKSR